MSASRCLLFSSRPTSGSRGSEGRAERSSSSYMRARNSALSLPMHHIFSRQGLQAFFFEEQGDGGLLHRLRRPAAEEGERPPAVAIRGIAAGESGEFRLVLFVEGLRAAGARAAG